MGEGNSNRGRKGLGRGTGRWNIEAGPPASLSVADPVADKEKRKKRKPEDLLADMEGGEAGVVYDPPPREKQAGAPNIPTPEISPEMPEDQANPADTVLKEKNRISVYRTGPTIETALRKPAEIETKKTTKEKLEECLGNSHLLLDDEDHIRFVLDKIDCHPTKNDIKKIGKLLVRDSSKLIGHIADTLIEKYKEEFIGEIIEADAFSEIIEDEETMSKIEEEIGRAAKDCYNQIWLKKKTGGKLAPAQKENGPKIAKAISKKDEQGTPAPELEIIGESGENVEQKKLREEVALSVEGELKRIAENIHARRDEMAQKGINPQQLEDGIKFILEREKEKIVGWCFKRIRDFPGTFGEKEKEIPNAAKYYTESAFAIHGNDAVREAYQRIFLPRLQKVKYTPEEIRQLEEEIEEPKSREGEEERKKERGIEEIFYREGRMEIIDKTIETILAVYGKLLEDSKKWDGYKDLPDAERIQSVTIDTKANIMNIYSLLVSQKGFPPGEKFKTAFYDYAVSRISK